MDHEARLAAMQSKIDEMEFRIQMLEDALFADAALPLEWGLTASEARVMGVLVNRDLASKQSIMAALYDGRDEAEVKIVNVYVCKIRRKLKPFGIEIRTVWGTGFSLVGREQIQRVAA